MKTYRIHERPLPFDQPFVAIIYDEAGREVAGRFGTDEGE